MKKLLLSLLLFPAALSAQQVKPAWETQPTYWDSGAYTYDGAGNIRTVGTDTYVYDAFGRLKSATAMTPAYPDNKQTFDYDPYGNQLKKTTFSGGQEHVTNYLVDDTKNQLTTDGTCPPGGLCVTGFYDAAGNQRGTVPNVVDYKWDALGMMSESNLTSRPEEYVYDANDERVVSMVKPGGTQRFTLRGTGNKVARELTRNPADGAWSWSRDYVYRDSALFAAYVGGESGPGPHRHYHLDHLGTPRLITDSGGYKLSTHTYWPYGKEAPGSEADAAERLRFTGHEYDSNPAAPGGDLYYMHARYYGQDWGRFLTVDPGQDWDPSAPQSWNMYAYVRGNPINTTDPTGRQSYSQGPGLGFKAHHVFVSIGIAWNIDLSGNFSVTWSWSRGLTTSHSGANLSLNAGLSRGNVETLEGSSVIIAGSPGGGLSAEAGFDRKTLEPQSFTPVSVDPIALLSGTGEPELSGGIQNTYELFNARESATAVGTAVGRKVDEVIRDIEETTQQLQDWYSFFSWFGGY